MVNKKFMLVFFTILAILSTTVMSIMTGCTEPATPTPSEPATPAEPPSEPEETIEINWLLDNTGQTPGGWIWKSVQNDGWAGAVESASNGRVKFNYLVGSVTPPGMFDSLVARAGDIAGQPTMVNSGLWPIIEVMTIPDLFSNCQRPARVAWELWQTFPEIQNEFKDVKLMAMYGTTPSPPAGIGFATVDKKITTLEDMKGVKMGIYGEWGTKTADALGFTSVAVPPWEVYEAMQRGVVDGSFMDVVFLTNQNVGEVAKYWVSCTLLFTPFWLGMNWDSWNSLPSDIQKIMEDLAPQIPDEADKYLKAEQLVTIGENPHVEIVDIDPEEQARWRERQDPVQAEYLAQLDAAGVDGKKVHEEMLRLFDVYKDALP